MLKEAVGVGGAGLVEMSNQVVKVKRETIAACMTCPLCNKLLRDATTISECLHTFCRRCIFKKLSDEESECCPICNIDLGCVPLEKLRPDHNLQDVRVKIFPFKRRKVNAPEVIQPVTLPVRRKERSLSALVVSTPRVSTQGTTTGRRTKVLPRKAAGLRSSSFSIEKKEDEKDVKKEDVNYSKKEDDPAEDHPGSSSSPSMLNNFAQNVRQSSSNAEPSGQLTPSGAIETSFDPWDTKADLWKPLNCLVEVANRTKSFKYNCQTSVKSEHPNAHDSEQPEHEARAKDSVHKRVANDDKTIYTVSPESLNPKKVRRVRRKPSSAFGTIPITPQSVLDASGAKSERRIGPIWFSLIASEEQQGDIPLPQISANYLRIKDGSLPVSFIQKYLMTKLDLTSEAEVEIKCMGQPVLPDLQMHNLVDLWVRTTSIPRKIPTSIGSSAKDFVMVLGYARRCMSR